MINTTELRIGNLVNIRYLRRSGEPYTKVKEVESIGEDGINLNAGPYYAPYLDYDHDLNQIEGILLTEEWLSKFGFILREQSLPEKCYKTKEGICLFIRDDRYQLRELIKTNMGFVSSVHQLQNLYVGRR